MSDFEQAFKERGINLTSSRLALFRVLETAETHLTVMDIFSRAKEIDKSLGLATVYRTLNTLCETGLVEKHEFPHQEPVYEKAVNKGHHHHIVDLSDGSVVEFPADELDAVLEEIARKHGYRMLGHKIEIYGEKMKA